MSLTISSGRSLPAWRHRQRWTGLLPLLIIGLTVLIGADSLLDMALDRVEKAHEARYQSEVAAVHLLQSALTQAESSVRGYVLDARPELLRPYLGAVGTLDTLNPALLSKLDRFGTPARDANATPQPVSDAVAELQKIWDSAIRLVDAGQASQAKTDLVSRHTTTLHQRLRSATIGYMAQQMATEEKWTGQDNALHGVLYKFSLTSAFVALMAMIYAFGSISRSLTKGFAAQKQVEQLFVMADMLQSAAGQEDTNDVLRAAAARLLPGLSGALYVFNNSRDRLDLTTCWGSLGERSPDHLIPTYCWALKRGKPHLNGVESGSLRCSHATDERVTLEIPMAARGQLYGLLEISAAGENAAARLLEAQTIASAMGDAMSLALSSIALRERLRSQALRDALTGLYNRRFLEETLERMCLEVEQRKISISAIMIDLDHFKKLNDEHGHSLGDAVLRDVAAAVLSCLRRTDVACRYGGEEIAILLPDCALAAASGKGEQIRNRIREMTSAAGIAVTASLGVASIPETSPNATELLAAADAALYRAKQEGRDRVVVAPSRCQATSGIDPLATLGIDPQASIEITPTPVA